MINSATCAVFVGSGGAALGSTRSCGPRSRTASAEAGEGTGSSRSCSRGRHARPKRSCPASCCAGRGSGSPRCSTTRRHFTTSSAASGASRGGWRLGRGGAQLLSPYPHPSRASAPTKASSPSDRSMHHSSSGDRPRSTGCWGTVWRRWPAPATRGGSWPSWGRRAAASRRWPWRGWSRHAGRQDRGQRQLAGRHPPPRLRPVRALGHLISKLIVLESSFMRAPSLSRSSDRSSHRLVKGRRSSESSLASSGMIWANPGGIRS